MPRLPAVLVPALLAAAPAASQPRSPCDAYVPTGAALPRQDTAASNAVLNPSPNPSYRDRRAGTVRKGDVVAVLQECGPTVRIRTPEGAEGWLSVVMLPNESRLARQANARPIVSDQDCELRWRMVPDAKQLCLSDLAKRQAREAEQASSRYLSAAELKTYLAGRTLEVWERGKNKGSVLVGRNYFAPSGEYFLAARGAGQLTWWRGWYVLDGERVCLPDTGGPCARLRRLADGRTLWVTLPGAEFDVEASQGDTAGTVAEVSVRYPKPKRPPTPAGLAGADGPMMGR